MLVVLASACEKPAQPAVSAPTPQERVTEFGGRGPAFVSWVEARGNFAITHRFDVDQNGDGRHDPLFGDHGEAAGDSPSVWLEPLDPPGPAERFDELLTTDPSARWAVLRRGSELVAVSADRRWPLRDADLTPDPSPCSPPRQASFDPTGTWLTYPRNAPPRAVVMHLPTGREREVPAEGVLWRAEAMPRGWVLLREVVEDTNGDGELTMPSREGTCVCRWCSRFATSVGGGRLVGDAARDVMVDAAGRRAPPPPSPMPVGPDLVWSLGARNLRAFDGAVRALPDGCELAVLPIGASKLVLSCHGNHLVWDPATGDTLAVRGRMEAADTFVLPAGPWVTVQSVGDTGRRLARLNLETGALEDGPPAVRWGAPHPSGWRLVADANKTHAYDPTTGTATALEGRLTDLEGLTARDGAEWVVFDPHREAPVARLAERPRFVAANGCYVAPHPFNEVVSAPFRWVCP